MIWGIFALTVVCILLLLKVARLQKELDNECSAELAEMREYARYLEGELRKNGGRNG